MMTGASCRPETSESTKNEVKKISKVLRHEIAS